MEKCATRNCIYKGFWQSEKYFRHCEDDIRKQFIFLPFDELKNIEVAAKMSQENSVAIHLRKGDEMCIRDRKEVISNHALCGAYFFSSGKGFLKVAHQLLDNSIPVSYTHLF